MQLIRPEGAFPDSIFLNTHICVCRNDFEFLECWMSTFGSQLYSLRIYCKLKFIDANSLTLILLIRLRLLRVEDR